jgi:hypothetical protein
MSESRQAICTRVGDDRDRTDLIGAQDFDTVVLVSLNHLWRGKVPVI